jgi:cell division control protein 12
MAAPSSDGIGIANLPNQVGLHSWTYLFLLKHLFLATQNRRQAGSSFHHHGRRFVTSFTLSREILSLRASTGESGLGKTTLINTLFSTELSTAKNYSRRHHKQLDKLTEVEIIKAELEEKQFKVKLTVIDTPGFGDYVNNRDSWSPIVDFIDDQHEAYMIQEQQPQRSEKSDLRVHACLYFIRPTGHT